VIIALLLTVLWHPGPALDTWLEDWSDQTTLGLSIELLDEYTDMATRHPGWFGRTVPHTHRPRRTYTGGVEQWRPLVERYFRSSDVNTALRIIACESGGNPLAKNRSSSAAGLWQFLRSTWDRAAGNTGSPSYAAGGPYDPTWATINAAWLRARGSGWNQWECF
jgi:hypothetical protein